MVFSGHPSPLLLCFSEFRTQLIWKVQLRGLTLNKIASDIGDIVCVGIHKLDIGVLNASCTARSSTITIGYVASAALAMVGVALLAKSRWTA